jgi:hypothetical protein
MDGPLLPACAAPDTLALSVEVEALQKERDALRVQAAAVAAQQAALMEEEIRLRQRATVLQRQEEQLAAHLEARRSQVAGLHQQVSAARAALRGERAEFEQQSRTLLADVERERAAASELRQRAERERLRFVALRKRLKQRWRKHWSAHEASLRRREKEVEDAWQRLASETDRLERDRDDQVKARLRCNAEMELGRRQLHDDRAQFAREQRSWAERRKAEHAELRRQAKALQERETLLARIERDLLDEKQQWEGARLHLEREVEGLESRARNQRQRLIDQQTGAIQPAAPVEQTGSATLPAPVIIGEAERQRLQGLERLAGDLADRRVQLAEQFARLLVAVESWRRAHVETFAEMENVAWRLQERERAVQARERGLDVAEADLRQRREDVAKGRCQLDASRARSTVRDAAWETEKATLLAHVRASEELTKRQLAVLDDLRRKWKQRRRQETTEFQKAHAQFVEARQLYASSWEECLRRSAAMDQEKRTLAEKTLALEQYRLEIVGQAEDAAAAERQLERLRRRWAGLFADGERSLARERQALQAEIGRVEARCRQVEGEVTALARREAELTTRRTEWEDHQFHVDEANVRLRKELESLRFERGQQERQLAALRDEVERMALTLLEQTETQILPTSQAA